MTTVFILFVVVFGILQISLCQPRLTVQEKDLIVELHNGYRKLQRASDMKKLKWDEALAREARLWADQCTYDFRLKSTGENMYYFESNLPNDILLERAIDAWYSERYTWKMSGDCADACSYTQLVWAKSKKIGCAVNRCPELTLPEEYVANAWYLYCVYDPKGNVYGNKPFRQGKACSSCEHNEMCSDKLCTEAKQSVRSLPRMQPGSNRRESPTLWEGLNKSGPTYSRPKKVVSKANFSPWSQQRIDITVPTPSPDLLKGPDMLSGIKSFRQRQREKQMTYYPQQPKQAFFHQQPQQQVPYQSLSDQANYGNKYNSSMQKLLMDDNAEALRLISGKGKTAEKESSSASGSNPQFQPSNKPIYSTMSRGRSNNLEKIPYQRGPMNPWQRKQIQARPVLAVRHFRTKPSTRPTTTTPKPTTTTPKPKPNFQPRRVVVGKIITMGNKFSLDDIRNNKTAVSFKFDHATKSPVKHRAKSSSSINTNGNAVLKTGFGNFMMDGKGPQREAIGHQLFATPTPVAKKPQTVRTGVIMKEDCRDNNIYCEHWVIYCKSNAYVFENCQKSCQNCDIPAPPPLPPPGGAPKLKKCIDLNEYCPHWKKYCYRNKYVTSQCQKQCGTCGHIQPEKLAMVAEGTTFETAREGYNQNIQVTADPNNVRDNRFLPTTTYANEINHGNMIPPRVKSFRQHTGNSRQQDSNYAHHTVKEMTTAERLAFRGHTAAPDTTTPYIPPEQPTTTTTLFPPTTRPAQRTRNNGHHHHPRRRNQARPQQRMNNPPHSSANHHHHVTTTMGWNNDPNVRNNYNDYNRQTTPYSYKETTTYSYDTNTDYSNVGASSGGNQCVDTDYRCVSWAEYCGRNPYTDQNCLKTCHYC